MKPSDDRIGILWTRGVEVRTVDIARHRVELEFSAPEQSKHVVKLEGVSKVAIQTSTDTWDYAEATEVGLFRNDGDIVFDVVLWDEPNQITVSCRELWMDGDLLASVDETSGPSMGSFDPRHQTQ